MPEVSIVAGELATALKDVGNKKKPLAVDLWFDAELGVVIVEEALHGLFAREALASGDANASAQIDGRLLRQLAIRYPADAVLTLGFGAGALAIACGRSAARLKATSVDRQPMPRNKHHKGRPEEVPEGRHLTPKGEQWAFSAQVPFKLDPDE